MRQFYAKAEDEYRCRRALIGKDAITITGLTMDGKIGAFTGRVQSVEGGLTAIPGYPLRITIEDLKPGELPLEPHK
jgi:hypothetical protein